MLDNNNVELSLIPDIPESTKEEVLNPAASLIGQAFRGMVHKVLDPLIRYNIVKDQELIDFTEKVQSKTGAIPIENRDDSKLGLTLKAVEDATYQLNSEKLREMFANLIAATVDNRKNNEVLPSFSSVLKDLSSGDAILLSELSTDNVFPIVSIRLENDSNQAGVDVMENIILFKDKFIHNPVSTSSLERSGLIFIQKTTYLASAEYATIYEEFKKSSVYQGYEKSLPRVISEIELNTINTTNGKLSLTPFGQEFISAVL